MKKLTSLLLSVTMLGGMISAVPASAETVPMFNVLDAIILQKYLHGKHSLSKFESKQYDLNADKTLNIFDLILLKKILAGEQIIPEVEQPSEFYTAVIPEANCTAGAWLMGLQQNPVICTSASQLQNNLKSMFPEASVTSLMEERYDAEFFTEHDLVLDFRIQGEDDQELWLNSASMTEDTITLNYRREYIDGFTETGIRLTQIVVPKITHQYQFEINIEGESAIPYEFSTMTQSGYFDEPLLINTYDEYQNSKLPEVDQIYTEEFFEAKSLYIYTDEEGYPMGSQRYGYSVSKSGDVVTITIVQRTVESDSTSAFADVVALDKADIENAEIQVKTIIIQS